MGGPPKVNRRWGGPQKSTAVGGAPKRGTHIMLVRVCTCVIYLFVLSPSTLLSMIFSDEWRAYCRLPQFGFQHDQVNHSDNYVNPVTWANTQAIEAHWEKPKRKILRQYRGIKTCLKWYLAEAWCRSTQMYSKRGGWRP